MILGVPKGDFGEGKTSRRDTRNRPEVRRHGLRGPRRIVRRRGRLANRRGDRAAGAEIVADAETLFARADLVLKVKQPTFNKRAGKHEVDMMREGTLLLTFLHPAAPSNRDMLRLLRERNITAMTMDGIPRTPAQRMDALTSMSTVTGYKSVLIAANTFPRFIPLIGTAIGAVKAAKFLIVGAGVVGLQAIATAKRLGGSNQSGRRQRGRSKGADSLAPESPASTCPPNWPSTKTATPRRCRPSGCKKNGTSSRRWWPRPTSSSSSASVPGEVAPVLVTDEMVAAMKPGSVIVDVAVDQGGNCEATNVGAETVKHQVTVLGLSNIPGSMPVDATWLYANNILHYVENLFKNGIDRPDMDDEIVRHTLVTYQGKLVHPGALKAIGAVTAHGELSPRSPTRLDHVRRPPDAFRLRRFLCRRVRPHLRIPPRLHTPLMSMTNAVSGVTILGAMLLFAKDIGAVEKTLGLAAVTLAAFNLVGGFAITDRMLRLFRRKAAP